MQLPQDFHKQGEPLLCKLNKSLFGFKQASRQWNFKLNNVLVKGGYCQSSYDHSFSHKCKVQTLLQY